ncbi:MAG: PEP-CTERM/exosortase system-associated acyltransferase [Pseudomonadota bacterium]
MDDIHSLRYAVYCKEKGFLDARKYPDGKEYDLFDDYSVHFAAYNQHRDLVGTVRLVIPTGEQAFPFMDFCTPLPGVTLPPKGVSAEISRLIIPPEAREQPEKDVLSFTSTLSRLFKGKPTTSAHEYTRVSPVAHHTTSPRILFGLFRKMYRYSKEHGIEYWYASMERPLERMLRRYHFTFDRISEPVDYYGPVSLYLGTLSRIEQDLGKHNPELLTWFQKSRGSAQPVEA